MIILLYLMHQMTCLQKLFKIIFPRLYTHPEPFYVMKVSVSSFDGSARCARGNVHTRVVVRGRSMKGGVVWDRCFEGNVVWYRCMNGHVVWYRCLKGTLFGTDALKGTLCGTDALMGTLFGTDTMQGSTIGISSREKKKETKSFVTWFYA